MNVVQCLRLWSSCCSSSVPLHWSLCSLCVQWSLPKANLKEPKLQPFHNINYILYLLQNVFILCHIRKPQKHDNTQEQTVHQWPNSILSIPTEPIFCPQIRSWRTRKAPTELHFHLWLKDWRQVEATSCLFLPPADITCSKPGSWRVLKRLVWMCVKLLTEPLNEMWMQRCTNRCLHSLCRDSESCDRPSAP